MIPNLVRDLLEKDPVPNHHQLGRGLFTMAVGLLASQAALGAYEKLFKLDQYK